MSEPREMLGLIPNGLFLIGVRTDQRKFIYTGSWLTQASFEPCLIATAVRRTHEGHGMIKDSGAFTVNFLDKGQLELAKVGFSNPDDRFERLDWKNCPETGAPVANDALGYVGCRVKHWVEGGDHDIVVAEAVIAESFRDGELLTIHDTPWTYS
ncbi:MAG: flavin reductase family protein [Acidobacteria bacterium]|nr:flavin reductase family protein [Acidobacteriota bacterium]